MSEPVLKAATSLYSEAIARGDILGVVLLVARHGKVVLYEAMGVRDEEKSLPMEKDTPFQIKSMTKPMVASSSSAHSRLFVNPHGPLPKCQKRDRPLTIERALPQGFAQGRS